MEQKRDSKGRFLPMSGVYARGIKGFLPGLICEPDSEHRKQYKENTVFEEKGGEICGPGVMHAAESAVSVLDHVPLISENGDLFEFAEVEALAPVQREGTKWATTKMRIGKKLSFQKFVKSFIDDVTKAVSSIRREKKKQEIISYRDLVSIDTCGFYAWVSSSGRWTRISSSGDLAQIASSGDSAQIVSSGNEVRIGCSSDRAQICASGWGAQIGSTGGRAYINSSGADAQIVSSGDRSHIGSFGTGSRIVSLGDLSRIGSSGDKARITSKGKGAVISAIGWDSSVSAELGSWIGLAEYNEAGNCVCAKFAKIDGVNLKPGVSYKLEDGEFKEVK